MPLRQVGDKYHGYWKASVKGKHYNYRTLEGNVRARRKAEKQFWAILYSIRRRKRGERVNRKSQKALRLKIARRKLDEHHMSEKTRIDLLRTRRRELPFKLNWWMKRAGLKTKRVKLIKG
jgi:hypothetical protein